MTVPRLYPIVQNDRNLLSSRIHLLESCKLPVIFRTRTFVLQALQGVLRKQNIGQADAVTIIQEFACLVGQLLQPATAMWVGRRVGNLESTKTIEATRNHDRYIK